MNAAYLPFLFRFPSFWNSSITISLKNHHVGDFESKKMIDKTFKTERLPEKGFPYKKNRLQSYVNS